MKKLKNGMILRGLKEQYGFKDVTFETVFNGIKQVCDKKVEYSLFLCMAKKAE